MVNDSSIALGITFIFVLIGGLLPFIQSDFSAPIDNNDPDGLLTNVGDDIGNINNESISGFFDMFSTGVKTVSALNVVFSIVTMFFWNFSVFPLWLNLAFTPIRLLLAYLVVRLIRGVG